MLYILIAYLTACVLVPPAKHLQGWVAHDPASSSRNTTLGVNLWLQREEPADLHEPLVQESL